MLVSDLHAALQDSPMPAPNSYEGGGASVFDESHQRIATTTLKYELYGDAADISNTVTTALQGANGDFVKGTQSQATSCSLQPDYTDSSQRMYLCSDVTYYVEDHIVMTTSFFFDSLPWDETSNSTVRCLLDLKV